DRAAHASSREAPAQDDLARRRIVSAQPGEERGLDRGLDVRAALVLVQDDGAGINVGLERVFAQDARAEGVDGRDLRAEELAPDALPARAVRIRRVRQLDGDDVADALLHLRRRLLREGDGEEVAHLRAGAEEVDE